jgi:hypothetical protein
VACLRYPPALIDKFQGCPFRVDTVAKVESRIGLHFFGEILKHEMIDGSDSLSRVAELAYGFTVRR